MQIDFVHLPYKFFVSMNWIIQGRKFEEFWISFLSMMKNDEKIFIDLENLIPHLSTLNVITREEIEFNNNNKVTKPMRNSIFLITNKSDEASQISFSRFVNIFWIEKMRILSQYK